ncbi:endospore germination permease [Saccharococcus sp. Marseille-Q5394]|uniref:endospore germination permease n=1 Tax=Saccharococcus sp. Marseille-Q5394 TaxID=2972778 RepID=UPI0021C7C79F|nr:endospore germination permease [Saccharococcus sp. Marseille-Q5394]
MERVGSISILHVILLSMTVIGLKNHVTILPPLLIHAGRDGWISVFIAAVAMVPWLFLLVYIHRSSQQASLGDWLLPKIGKVPTAIFRYVTAFFLLLMAVFTMAETLQWIKSTFLPESPLVLMILIYSILCIFLASTNLQTIVMVNVVVLFWVVILGFFVAFTNIQVKNYSLLRPFIEHGFEPVISTLVYPASGYIELLLFLFIQQNVKGRFRWYHFAIMLFILHSLTMGPLIGAITEFGPDEAAKQRYPAYEEWGLVSIGRFIEHLDFFSIYQWLTGTFVRVSFILYVVSDLLQLRGDRKRIWKIIGPAFFFMSLSLFLMEDHIFLKLKGDYFLIATFIFLLLLTLFLTISALIKRSAAKEM